MIELLTQQGKELQQESENKSNNLVFISYRYTSIAKYIHKFEKQNAELNKLSCKCKFRKSKRLQL